MNVLVTGGAEFIGSHLVSRIVQLGKGEVHVIDDLSLARWSIDDLRSKGALAHKGDILDTSALRRAMTACRAVVHLAARATVMGCESDPVDAFAVNAVGACRVLAVAKELVVQRVVFASSREVYGDARSIPVSESSPLHAMESTTQTTRRSGSFAL